ncbi:MAG: glycerophosphodiester phosphodiesterase [Thermoproteus sp. AZ2]|jgi:glycerophosphoryl diester phosphodiesterase|uniref:Glycerophosphodiester phosphodiesterase n=1 Tax=Thermoproteus sp. AZ2 TaxID=1609232 RepID=A0ACC6V0Z9_9CREN|nr:MAG: glycerophosphodiester phosphodiesterase [Thermoproteus sp. AZ2]
MNKVLEALSKKAVVGHRGFPLRAPENTIASFKAAIEAGVDLVEMDIQRSLDGVVFLLHDDDLARLAGVGLRVREAKWAEIAKHKARGEPIPTLEDALGFIDGRVGALIEVKHPEDSAAVREAIARAGAAGWVAVISFYAEALRPLKGLVPLGLIYARPPGAIAEAKREGFDIVLPQYRLATERSNSFAHRLGLKVIAWTINDEAAMEEAWRRGADAVASDNAELAVRVKRRLYG